LTAGGGLALARKKNSFETKARSALSTSSLESLTFVKSDQGVVTELILHQNGRNMPGKKIR
jgi:hypothetical protein